jgi:quinol monooxygenase YgiN
MTKVALLVELTAKPGKQEDLATFLTEAQPLAAAEPKTSSWFAVRFAAQKFAIFDTFDDDDGRKAHLGGRIAAALMARADELLDGAPEIKNADVLASMLKSTGR